MLDRRVEFFLHVFFVIDFGNGTLTYGLNLFIFKGTLRKEWSI